MAILAASFAFEANELGLYLFGWKWPMHCVLYHTFGIKCAFCGMSRSFAAMADGNFQQGWNYHRLGSILFGFILLQIPYRIWALTVYPKKVAPVIRRSLSLLGVAVLIAVFVNWLFYIGGRLL